MAETSPLAMSSGIGYTLNETFFWERLISDEGIVSIRVLSAVAFWSILIAAEAILFVLFRLLIGFIPMVILLWAYTRGTRSGVKRAAASGTLGQLARPRTVIKWDEIASAKVKKGSLEVVTSRRKQKFVIPKASRDNAVSFLSGKLGPKLTVAN